MNNVWTHFTHLDRPQFWVHDCDQCRMLGQVRELSMNGEILRLYDLFLCCDSDEEGIYAVRFSNDPSDNITRDRIVWKIAAENGDELSKQVMVLINSVNAPFAPLAVVSQPRG